MLTSLSLRRARRAALAVLFCVVAPAAARADGPGCGRAQSFWRDTADACAECAARLRQAQARGSDPAPAPYYRRAEPFSYRTAPAAAAYVRRDPPSARTRAPGLLPVTVASAERTHAAVGRALDPVVDPLLRDTTQAVGTVAGTALGVALYPPFKILEHVFGAED